MAKKLTCKKCGRKFSMPAHLARHMSSHGSKSKKVGTKSGKRRGRPPGSKNKVRRGPRSVAGINLGKLNLDDLTGLIAAARAEARKKVHELKVAVG